MINDNFIFIGIDFSINSPGVCIFNSVLKKYKFISFINDNEERLKKEKIPKCLKIYKTLKDNNLAEIIFYNRRKRNSDYSVDQFQKIEDAINLSKVIIYEIDKLKIKSENIIIGIEGYSYGSKGNAFIDLISFNSILRAHLYDAYGNKDKVRRLYVFSPSEIKKFAGKGNANKKLMFNFLMENKKNDIVLKENSFYKWLKEQTYEETIPKPIDDLVDAYWICKYLIELDPCHCFNS